MYSDLLVARLVFSGDEAGAYAAAAVASKVLLLVPIAATTVLFPRVAVLHDRARERQYLLAGLGVVAAASAALTASRGSSPSRSSTSCSARSTRRPSRGWARLCLAMALYGLAIVYLYHFLALGRARVAVVLVLLLAAQTLAYALFHGEPADLIGVQIAVRRSAVLACEAWYLLRR